MQCALEEGGSDQTNLMRWREATRELFLKITVKCNCRVLVSAMAGLKRAAPSIETSDEVPLFASRNVDSCDKPRIEVLTARDWVEDSDDDVPVYTPGKHGPTTPPTAATAPVRKEDPLQVIQETIGGWRLVRLDGQYVRVKLTRKEMFSIYGGKNAETSEDEDSEPEPDYLIAGESKPYIDRSQDDDTENLGLFLLISSTRAANDARQTVVALGTGSIEFKTYSEKR